MQYQAEPHFSPQQTSAQSPVPTPDSNDNVVIERVIIIKEIAIKKQVNSFRFMVSPQVSNGFVSFAETKTRYHSENK